MNPFLSSSWSPDCYDCWQPVDGALKLSYRHSWWFCRFWSDVTCYYIKPLVSWNNKVIFLTHRPGTPPLGLFHFDRWWLYCVALIAERRGSDRAEPFLAVLLTPLYPHVVAISWPALSAQLRLELPGFQCLYLVLGEMLPTREVNAERLLAGLFTAKD